MPLETKKVLWIVLSMLIVVLVATGIGMVLFIPKGPAAAPASIAGTSPPRAASPDAYVRNPEPAPVPVPGQDAPAGDSVIIIYGDKPAEGSLPAIGSPGSAGTVPADPASTAKPYVPAPASGSATATATAKPAPKPAAAAPKPAPKATTEYWIQAGSFTGRSRAEDLQRELAAKGLSSVITVKEIDGTTWFPVRVGPYTAKSEADGWLARVKALPGCDEAYVSQLTVTR